jgi:transcriptional regulator
MYVPRFNAVEDEQAIRTFVAAGGAAELITTGADGYPASTLLPIVWDGARVIAHFARANPHWMGIEPDSPCLLVVRGAQAYVSPSWYATKREHGKVVPTWNYSAVQLRGRATVHDDPDWVREAVTLLTDTHEAARDDRWSVTDAPEKYVAGQLRAIVGVEVLVESVEGKAKLSQNRSEDDRRGVVEGLSHESAPGAAVVASEIAADLEHVLDHR